MADRRKYIEREAALRLPTRLRFLAVQAMHDTVSQTVQLLAPMGCVASCHKTWY
jgi:hypothetical protein